MAINTAEIGFRAVCWMATGCYHFLQAIALESLMAFALITLIGFAIVLLTFCSGQSGRGNRRRRNGGIKSLEQGSAVPLLSLAALAFVFMGPGMNPLEVFPMDPYESRHYPFDAWGQVNSSGDGSSGGGFPRFPPLFGPSAGSYNDTLTTSGPWFMEARGGRHLLLRGVNLGGATKVPASPDGATWRNESSGFWLPERGEAVSFVGRPFELEEADEHLGRLRAWGLTFVRLLVTWEAIEHAGV